MCHVIKLCISNTIIMTVRCWLKIKCMKTCPPGNGQPLHQICHPALPSHGSPSTHIMLCLNNAKNVITFYCKPDILLNSYYHWIVATGQPSLSNGYHPSAPHQDSLEPSLISRFGFRSRWLSKFNGVFLVQRYIFGKIFKIRSIVFTWICQHTDKWTMAR